MNTLQLSTDYSLLLLHATDYGDCRARPQLSSDGYTEVNMDKSRHSHCDQARYLYRIIRSSIPYQTAVSYDFIWTVLDHPRSGVMYNFGLVCLSVCMAVCQTITSESVDVGRSFFCTCGLSPGNTGQVRV